MAQNDYYPKIKSDIDIKKVEEKVEVKEEKEVKKASPKKEKK